MQRRDDHPVPLPPPDARIVAAQALTGVRLPAGDGRRRLAQNGRRLEPAEEVWQTFPVVDNRDTQRTDRRTRLC